MKSLLRCAFPLLAFLCGCSHLTETELSSQGVGGARYECLQEMHVSGIKRELSSPRYDYITLFPAPGIAGPEVVDLGTIPAGTLIEIDGVLQQGPALLSRVIYRVKILGPSSERFAQKDVRLADWARLYSGRDSSRRPVLSPDFFRLLK